MIKARTTREGRICQGDIIADVEHVEYVIQKGGYVEVSRVTFPLVIVLTQDCDLMQDYRVRWSRQETPNQDKLLVSTLLAPLYNAEHLREGTHLEDLGRTMQRINSDRWKILKNNETPRYHYVQFEENVTIVPSVIDFKHYFSVNVEYLKKLKRDNFVCRVAEIYREDISLRYASFLARIGLPDVLA